VPALNNLAVVRFFRDDRREALEYIRQVVSRHPNWAAANYNCGVMLAVAGIKDEASTYLARADELLPASSRLGEAARKDVVEDDYSRRRFTTAFALPEGEFSMTFALALIPVPAE
jgi:hypothetical protein